MSRSPTLLTADLRDYMLRLGSREEPLLRALRLETAELPGAGMQIAPEEGQLLRFLVGALGARRTLEIGLFTGYSALCTALSLPEDGCVVACDVSPHTSGIARRYFERAGLSHKLDIRLGPALETLADLLRAPGAGAFDFAFIDADKENLLAYYERSLELVRSGGVIAVDNVFWGGEVTSQHDSPSACAVREFNERVHADTRVDLVMLPIADGLTLLRKVE